MGTTTSRGYRKPASTDNFSNLHVDIGNVADDVNDDMDDTWGADWTDFSATFAWTAGTTNPTKGSGTTYSARTRLLNATTAIDVVKITIGSGFSAGSGVYFFSLGNTPADSEGYGTMGSCFIRDDSTSTEFTGTVRITTSRVVLYLPAQSGSTTNNTAIKSIQVTNSVPMTPASSDVFRYAVIYEI